MILPRVLRADYPLSKDIKDHRWSPRKNLEKTGLTFSHPISAPKFGPPGVSTLNVHRNPIRHILTNITQKQARNNAQTSERNTRIPNIFQTVRIGPPRPDYRGLHNCRRQAQNIGGSKLLRSRQKQAHKCRGGGHRQPGFNGVSLRWLAVRQ